MIAAYMDSTNLKPDATRNDIISLCHEAAWMEMAAVCINPYRVSTVIEVLADSQVRKCTVIGFPLGAEKPAQKLLAARQALMLGADELDMVINVGALKDKDYNYIDSEIKALLALKEDYEYILKVIVETALLSAEELATVTQIVSSAQADFIKTSTGFSTRGASLEDIRLIKCYKSEALKIKASGGIRTLDSALAFIEAGVHRIGSSQAGVIVEEYRKRGGL